MVRETLGKERAVGNSGRGVGGGELWERSGELWERRGTLGEERGTLGEERGTLGEEGNSGRGVGGGREKEELAGGCATAQQVLAGCATVESVHKVPNVSTGLPPAFQIGGHRPSATRGGGHGCMMVDSDHQCAPRITPENILIGRSILHL